MPSRSKCINNSPPLRYSSIRYSFPSVWKAYTSSTINGCCKHVKWISMILYIVFIKNSADLYLYSLEYVALGTRVCRVLLVGYYGCLFQHLHGKMLVSITSSCLAHLSRQKGLALVESFDLLKATFFCWVVLPEILCRSHLCPTLS